MTAKNAVYDVVFTARTMPSLATLSIAMLLICPQSFTSISPLSPFQTFPWRKDRLEFPSPCLSLEGSHAQKLAPLLVSYLPGLTGGNAIAITAQIHDVDLLGHDTQDQESCHQGQNHQYQKL